MESLLGNLLSLSRRWNSRRSRCRIQNGTVNALFEGLTSLCQVFTLSIACPLTITSSPAGRLRFNLGDFYVACQVGRVVRGPSRQGWRGDERLFLIDFGLAKSACTRCRLIRHRGAPRAMRPLSSARESLKCAPISMRWLPRCITCCQEDRLFRSGSLLSGCCALMSLPRWKRCWRGL